MKIKICGIQTRSDVEIMNKYLPDAVGFIFYEKSERYINVPAAKILCGKLNDSILKVGVFVNSDKDEIIKTSRECGLDIIQLHGEEDNKLIKYIKKNSGCEVWKAIRIENKKSLEKINSLEPARFLLDAYVKEYGGEGKKFNWDVLNSIDTSKVILAGGINCENIEQAINTIRPYMIDVSHGAAENGTKDEYKVKKLIEAVRKYE